MGTVIVIGAGYAGVRAAKAAARHGADVLLVDADGRHHFGPRLPGVAAGSAAGNDGAADVESLTGIPVEVAKVRRIERGDLAVVLDSGARHLADAVVVTTGSAPARPPIDGLAEHALDCKTAQDAVAIRERVERSRSAIVIGAGSTGMQLAGELAARDGDLEVHVVERGHRLLPELSSIVAARAARILRQRGVQVHLGHEVATVTADGITLDDGTQLAGTTIWAGGFEPVGHDLLPGADDADGRIRVRDTLELDGWPGVFVAGDAAAHVDVLGRQVGMSAQIAVQAGKAAGRNAALVASGRDAIRAFLLDLGRVVTMGGGRGVAQLGPVPVGLLATDRLVPLLHEAIDIRHLVQTGGLRALLRHGRGQNGEDRRHLRLVASHSETA